MKTLITILMLTTSLPTMANTYAFVGAHPDDGMVGVPILHPVCHRPGNKCYVVSITDGDAWVDSNDILRDSYQFARYMGSQYVRLALKDYTPTNSVDTILSSWNKSVVRYTDHKSLSAYLKWGFKHLGATDVVIIDPVEAAGGHPAHTATGFAVLRSGFTGPVWSITSKRIWNSRQIGLCPNGDRSATTYTAGWSHVIDSMKIFDSLFDAKDILKVSPRKYYNEYGWLGNQSDCMTVNYKRVR